ncbi:response regulator [Paraliomyxa miuraensis]|uniref:response regulator n=1 Tax=Paraliomyxa miuraensis TaxID=376150 RepID=UPI002252D713|nr:response regulator [Paraliomyxa miuraensis]
MRVAVALAWIGIGLVPVMAIEYVQRGRLLLVAALGLAVLGFFGVLWLVRTRGLAGLAGHTMAALLSVTLLESKGLYDPPILGPLVFPVMVTFASGRRGGWVWCGLGIAAFAWQAARTPGDAAANGAWVMGLCLIVISLTAMAHVFEVAQERSFLAQERAREAIQNAVETKSRFLANMSHEIRTPMNGVLGMLGILLDTPLRDDQHECAKIAHDSGVALLGLLDDVLDFSKIDAGQLVLRRAPFRLCELVESVLTSLEVSASRKGIELRASYGLDLPPLVLGDQQRVRQILINLVGNAIKFTDRGYVRVRVEARAAGGDEARIHCSVEDTGIGIAVDEQPSVFDSFQQVDGSTTRLREGVGLGLAIVSELVQMMGGTRGVLSEPGRGSTFWFELPLPAADEAAAAEHSDRVHGQGGLDGEADEIIRGMRVLVVEDNAINRRVAHRLLSNLGCHVELACDGHEAVTCVELDGYDLVLMDVQMPRMDGLQATVEIRRREQGRGRRLPIVALTAHAMLEDRERCLAVGMDGYVTKPIQPRELVTALREHGLRAGPRDGRLSVMSPMLPHVAE